MVLSQHFASRNRQILLCSGKEGVCAHLVDPDLVWHEGRSQ